MRGKIEWAKTRVVVVKSVEEGDEVVGFFNANGQRVTNSRTVWLDWLGDNSYNFENIKGTYMLYATFYKDYEAVRFYYNVNKDINEASGREARETLQAMFKERTGMSLRRAFGTVDNVEMFAGFQYAPII